MKRQMMVSVALATVRCHESALVCAHPPTYISSLMCEIEPDNNKSVAAMQRILPS